MENILLLRLCIFSEERNQEKNCVAAPQASFDSGGGEGETTTAGSEEGGGPEGAGGGGGRHQHGVKHFGGFCFLVLNPVHSPIRQERKLFIRCAGVYRLITKR